MPRFDALLIVKRNRPHNGGGDGEGGGGGEGNGGGREVDGGGEEDDELPAPQSLADVQYCPLLVQQQNCCPFKVIDSEQVNPVNPEYEQYAPL